MNNNENESGDQFQTHKDQFTLTTYAFTRNIPSLVLPVNKQRKKVQQKLSLKIIKTNDEIQLQTKKDKNKNKIKKNMYGNQGKIIKIGQAIFKSNFQSGNLGEVQLKSLNTYKITMDKQYNSNRTSSWFYFRCQGLKGQINFIISGFTKSASLYSQGMKVCYRQLNSNFNNTNSNNTDLNTNVNTQNNKQIISQWKRGCMKISYSQGYSQGQQDIYELKFTYFFKTIQSSPVQFAYCFPYQYSRVIKLIKTLNFNKSNSQLYCQSLGRSYQGRDIPILTIGNPNSLKSIVLSARVHPGQTVASFIIEGFLKQLVSDSEFACSLKQKYLFKIIPMINPDGVVRGNYRFSGAGYDLNRRWKHCYQTSHPQIYYLKNIIKKLHKQKKVLMYIDIHGHSRRKNVFFYGCCSKDSYLTNNNNNNNNIDDDQDHISKPKQFPYLMQKINQNYKYQYCTFNMTRDKQGTARISMWKQLHIDHVYTLESSLCGSLNGNNYVQQDYFNIGKSLLQGISIYFYQKPNLMTDSLNSNKTNNTNKKARLFQKYLNILDEAKQELKSSPYLLNIGMNDHDSGSDSQPQKGIIPEEERKVKSTLLKLQIPSFFNQQYKIKQQPSFFNQNNTIKDKDYESTKKSIKFNLRTAPSHLKKPKISSQQLKNIVDQRIQGLLDQQQRINDNKNENKLLSTTFTNFYSYNSQHLNSLTTQSLSHHNQRVHSNKNQNSNSFFHKLKNARINSQNQIFELNKNEQQQQRKRLQIMNRNLLKTRQGAQYRRVKIMAEQMKRKTNSFNGSLQQQTTPIVRGIQGVNNQLMINKKRVKSIAPSFYPQNNNYHIKNNKRLSMQSKSSYRNNSNRSNKITQIGTIKLFINGDQLSVKCKGNKIFM